MDEAQSGYVKNPIPMLQPVIARKARIYLKQGRLDKARVWARERSLSVTDEADYLGEYEHLTLARTRLAEHLFDGVGQMLERLLALAESQKRMGSIIEILVTQALLYQAQGDHPKALVALERTLKLAEPECYIRIFVDEGEVMRLLIEKQSRNTDHPLRDYVNKLLAAFTKKHSAPKSAAPAMQRTQYGTSSNHHKSDFIEPLSDRELEVLKLLRSELSGPEIAQQLVVSLNTLRTHTKNIYKKLGVNDRRTAIRRAEELELF